MPTVTCPQCNGRLDVPFEQLGAPVACPHCRGLFSPIDGAPIPSRPRRSNKRSNAELSGVSTAAAATSAPAPMLLPRPAPLPPDGKIVLAIEGADGAGKSTLLDKMKLLCDVYGRRLTRIGRRGKHAHPLVGRMTRLLHEEGDELTPFAEISLRLARESQRADLAAAAPAGIVVLDRFVISLLALIRNHGENTEPFLPVLRQITERAGLYATIFVECPFDVAWDRLRRRDEGSAVRDLRGQAVLQRLAQLAEEEFRRGEFTGRPWPIENSGPFGLSEQALARYLVPFLDRSEVL